MAGKYFDYEDKFNKLPKDGDFKRLEADWKTENIRLDFNASKLKKLDSGEMLLGLNVIACSGLSSGKKDLVFPMQISLLFHNAPWKLKQYDFKESKDVEVELEPTTLDKAMIAYLDTLDESVNYTGNITLQDSEMLEMFVDGEVPWSKFKQVSFTELKDDKSQLEGKDLSISTGKNGKGYAKAESQADKVKARVLALKDLVKTDLGIADDALGEQTLGSIAIQLNGYFAGLGIKQPVDTDSIYIDLLKTILS